MRRRSAVAAATACVLAVLAGGCTPSGDRGGDGDGTGTTGGRPSTAAFVIESFDLQVSPSPPEVVDRARAGVAATLDAYLQRAVVQPLATRGPAGDLAPLFTGPAAGRLTGPDRAALVDEGLAAVQGAPLPETAVARLSALSAPDGSVAAVAARVGIKVAADEAGTRVAVERTGDLVLVPEGDTWKIDGYDVVATRRGPAGATTSTAATPVAG